MLPAFVFRWLRETSATGHMRAAVTPNKRVQDGLKMHLLCAECEALFNSFETPFANRVFFPYANEEVRQAPYAEWMAKFCASLAWRIVVFGQRLNALPDLRPIELEALEKALSIWKLFIEGAAPNPSEFELHVLPAGLVGETSVPDMPNNFNRYMTRTVDVDVAVFDKRAFTFAKLGPILFFGFIREPEERWIGTRVKMKQGLLVSKHCTLPAYLMSYLFDRCRKQRAFVDDISEAQWEKIEQTLMKNLEKAANSLEFKALARDAEMFGIGAVVRRPKS